MCVEVKGFIGLFLVFAAMKRFLGGSVGLYCFIFFHFKSFFSLFSVFVTLLGRRGFRRTVLHKYPFAKFFSSFRHSAARSGSL